MRSIRTAKKFDPVVDELCSRLFIDKRDLYVFVALLAYRLGHSSPPETPHSSLDGRVFEHRETNDAVLALALAITGNKEVLADTEVPQEKVAQLFEEHIDAGLSIVDGWLKERPTVGTDAILSGLRSVGLLDVEPTALGYSDVEF